MVLIVLPTLVAGISAASVVASQSSLLLRIPYYRNQLSGDHNYVLFSSSGITCRSVLLSPTLSSRVEATVPMLQLWPVVPAMPNRLTRLRISTASVRAMGHAQGSMELMGRSVTLMKTIWHVYG